MHTCMYTANKIKLNDILDWFLVIPSYDFMVDRNWTVFVFGSNTYKNIQSKTFEKVCLLARGCWVLNVKKGFLCELTQQR